MTDESISSMDPFMLLSMINMKLRDFYGSLSSLCDDLNITKSLVEKRLEEAALKYATDNYIEGNKITIEKNLLVSSSLIGEVYDLENKNAVCDGYVVIDIVNNTAKSYIKCENYQTEGYVG